jgi:filamentous hemagglutinin family protein
LPPLARRVISVEVGLPRRAEADIPAAGWLMPISPARSKATRAKERWMSARTTCPLLGSAAALALLGSVCGAMAQVTLDGTANPSIEGPLDGPDYQIRAELGRRAGRNLFHSFERFGLRTGESASFSGPDAIRNVISRVTGGEPSNIDGTLRSTIPGADFYFLNPAGIMFGPNASLDLQGSFHVSTADELRFEGGERFSADLDVASSFTVAPPEAFGFLGTEPGAIKVDRSTLVVPAGKAFSIVGGDVTIDGGNNGAVSGGDDGTVRAEAGQITLAAVGAEGRLTVATGELEAETRRDISLTDQAQVDTTGDGGGTIRISGGRIVAENAEVFADNNGVRNGRDGLDIDAEVLRVRRGSALTADALDEGTGGDVIVRAGTLEVSGDSRLAADTFAQGSAGTVTVMADGLVLDNLGFISSDTSGEGDAGTVTVRANDVVLRRSFIRSDADGDSEGDAGAVTVMADDLVLDNLGFISSDTSGEGDAGTVTVRANDVILRRSFIRSESDGEGDAGAVTVMADDLVLDNIGFISSDTFGEGDAGTITVRANDVVLRNTSAITSDTLGEGDAGTITVSADDLILRDGGSISSDSSDEGAAGAVTVVAGNLVARGSFISSEADGAGDAGTVVVRANHVVLRDSNISSSTFGEGDAGAVTVVADNLVARGSLISTSTTLGEGDAGTVVVRANHVVLRDSSLSSGTDGAGDAGTVTVVAGNLVARGSGISTSTTFGEGDAGTVVVRANDVVLRDSAISSSTSDEGDAGKVTVSADDLILRDGGLIGSDSSDEGNAGAVMVTADKLLISGVPGLFTGISSETLDPNSTANAGIVTVAAVILDIRSDGTISSAAVGEGDAGAVTVTSDRLLIDRGQITTSSASAGGGEIRLLVEDVIDLRNSTITTSVAGGNDPTAGSITIDPKVLVIDGSTIKADALAGTGGNIQIIADNILVPEGDLEGLIARGEISASGETEASSGTVAFSAPEADISGGLVVLDAALLDAASQLRQRCGARRDVGASSFTGVGRGGLPPSPDGPLAGAYALEAKRAAAIDIEERDGPKAAPGAVTLVLPCRGPA